MQLARAARIILVGAPGVGKGTQAERLMKRFPQVSAISSGDLLRENVRNKTPLGVKAESRMKAGALVPDGVIINLILGELQGRNWISTRTESPAAAAVETEHGENSGSLLKTEQSDDPGASFILDGFPRTAVQASQLDALITINLVVNILTPASIIIDRIGSRRVHAASGRVYNSTFNPPKVEGKDDVTGEPLTRRDDDDPETWKARLRKFEETSRPLLEHYQRKGVLWTVQGDSSDEISPKLFGEIERRFG
ncbi:MAG: hypothetical protein M1825_001807 [Sarcosagium campestre]|nr:MAG: hypothetical protein M1825_001807 [Sarcosagium campestre]